jgi:putative sigma-54 modulation protein
LAPGRNTGTAAPIQAFAAVLSDFLCRPGRTLSLAFVPGRLHSIAMNLILSTHNVTLTKAIEDHIISRIAKLEHLDRFAINARVTFEHDQTKAPERQFSCSIRLSVPGPDLFAEDVESDLYAAMDLVAKKIEQQIRKRHNKHKARKHKQAARGKRSRQEKEL